MTLTTPEFEALCLVSWDDTERKWGEWVQNNTFPHYSYMYPLIGLMRDRGYDRSLCACALYFTLSLGRTLYPCQNNSRVPRLIISPLKPQGLQAVFVASGQRVTLNVSRVQITSELENLFIPLLVHPFEHDLTDGIDV